MYIGKKEKVLMFENKDNLGYRANKTKVEFYKQPLK